MLPAGFAVTVWYSIRLVADLEDDQLGLAVFVPRDAMRRFRSERVPEGREDGMELRLAACDVDDGHAEMVKKGHPTSLADEPHRVVGARGARSGRNSCRSGGG